MDIYRNKKIERKIFTLGLAIAIAVGLIGCAPTTSTPLPPTCRRDAELTYHIPNKPSAALGEEGECDLPKKVFEILGIKEDDTGYGRITVSRSYILIGSYEDGSPLYAPNPSWAAGEVRIVYRGHDGTLIRSASCTSNPIRTTSRLIFEGGDINLSCFTDQITVSPNK